MPVNDYNCPVCGDMELYFDGGNYPLVCPDCNSKITFVIAPNQFSLGGDMTILDEPTRRSVHMQLGERVETREELRALEKRKKMQRIEKHEFYRGPDGPRWEAPPKVDVAKAIQAAKAEGTYPKR